MGVTQSIGSLARIIGPFFAFGLLDVSIMLPYFICAFIAVVAAIVAAIYLKPGDKPTPNADADSTASTPNLHAESENRAVLRKKQNEDAAPAGDAADSPKPARINLRGKSAGGDKGKPSSE